jgi:hypothetical protein
MVAIRAVDRLSLWISGVFQNRDNVIFCGEFACEGSTDFTGSTRARKMRTQSGPSAAPQESRACSTVVSP